MGYAPESGGVFVSRWHHGSPAHRYGLYALVFIESINGVPCPDLDAFISATVHLEDGSFARVAVKQLNSRSKEVIVKVDNWYWPLVEMKRRSGLWTRTVLASSSEPVDV